MTIIVGGDPEAGENDRDRLPAARAPDRQIENLPNHSRPLTGDQGEAVSCDSQISLLRSMFGARIEAVRRTTSKRDRVAAIKALRQELKAAILAVTERKLSDRAARRLTFLARQNPPILTR
jgi:hypothetical protein